MATKHVCDVCGSEVRHRHDLWNVDFSPAEKEPGMPDGRRFERFEVCRKCKRRAYTSLMEAGR